MGARRTFWSFVGVAAVALAIAGVVLPLLPTTPFLLIAAWAFGKSSPRLHGWLLGHPRFGPLINDWRRHGAIPRRAKYLALLLMGGALAGGWLAALPPWLLAVQGAVLLVVAAFLFSRPDAPRAAIVEEKN
jgi:hypothetical protein